LVIALEPLGHNIVTSLQVWLSRFFAGRALVGMTGHGIITGTLSAAAAGILFGVLLQSILLTSRRRTAHRMLLDLLTASYPGFGADSLSGVDRGIADVLAGVRILDHSTAVAYTLPGWHSRVVLSVGMLNLLEKPELVAVIDHERAHVRSRHDLLVLPFQAWGTAVGWLPGVRAAAESVAELTEMLADDWAARRSSSLALAKALATVALAGATDLAGVIGSPTPAVAGRSVAIRVERLLGPSTLPALAIAAVYFGAALLLALPFAALLVGWR